MNGAIPKTQSGGALKLLDDLDQLESLLGNDFLTKPKTSKLTPKYVMTEQHPYKKVVLDGVVSGRNGTLFNDALTTEALNAVNGSFTDANGKTHKLAEAFDRELINPDSVTFISPENGEIMNVQEAIQHGFIQKTGHYIDPSTGKRLKLRECLDRYIIVPRDINLVEKEPTPRMEITDDALPDLSDQRVIEVVDPDSERWIPVHNAITRGIYDSSTECYFNHKTGQRLELAHAYKQNLLKMAAKGLEESVDSTDTDILLDDHPTGVESKNINYTSHVSDMSDLDLSRDSTTFFDQSRDAAAFFDESQESNSFVDQSEEASRAGINKEPFSMERAAHAEKSAKSSPVTPVNPEPYLPSPFETMLSSLNPEAVTVVDPRTTLMISYKEACQEGVIENGYYYNIAINQRISVQDALRHRLILVDPDKEGVMKERTAEADPEIRSSTPVSPAADRVVCQTTIIEESEELELLPQASFEPVEIPPLNLPISRSSSEGGNNRFFLSTTCSESTSEISLGAALSEVSNQADSDLPIQSGDHKLEDGPIEFKDLRTDKSPSSEGSGSDIVATVREINVNDTQNTSAMTENSKTQPLHKIGSTPAIGEIQVDTSSTVIKRSHSEADAFKSRTSPKKRGERLSEHSEVIDKLEGLLQSRVNVSSSTKSPSPSKSPKPKVLDRWPVSRAQSQTSNELNPNSSAVSSAYGCDRNQTDKLTNNGSIRLGSLTEALKQEQQLRLSKQRSDSRDSKSILEQQKKASANLEPETSEVSAADIKRKEQELINRVEAVIANAQINSPPDSPINKSDLLSDEVFLSPLLTPFSKTTPRSIEPEQIDANGDGTEGEGKPLRTSIAKVPAHSSAMNSESAKFQPRFARPQKTLQLHGAIGALSYQSAVRLGLFSVKSGRFCDPVSLCVIGLNEACRTGYIDVAGPALRDLKNDRVYSLRECFTLKLIDQCSGTVIEANCKQQSISVANVFVPSLTYGLPSLHLLDAIKIGLLSPYTGEFSHPDSDKTSNIGEAVAQGFISGRSVRVNVDKMRYTLSEALKKQLINSKTGDIVKPGKKDDSVSFYEAVMSSVIETAYRPGSMTTVHPETGEYVEINQAIRLNLLGHENCMVFDSQQNRQVTYDEALASGIIDRNAACYTDKSGVTISCQKAVQLGLIEPIASPVCSHLYLGTCIERLYSPSIIKQSVVPKPHTTFEKLASPERSLTHKHLTMTKNRVGKYRLQPVQEPMIIREVKVKANSVPPQPPEPEPVKQSQPPSKPVVVSEQVIQLGSKKVRTSPPKPSLKDNISATEYFTKGETGPTIHEEDDHDHIDSYKVNLQSGQPGDIDWNQINIRPLRKRAIVIESRERAPPPPPPDKQIIIIEKEKEPPHGLDINAALEKGFYDISKGLFTHPWLKSAHPVSLSEAHRLGYITGGTLRDIQLAVELYRRKHAPSVMEYTVTKDALSTPVRSPRGKPLSALITAGHLNTETGKYKDPSSLIHHSLADAVKLGLIDGESAWFTNPASRTVYTLQEALDDRLLDSYGRWVGSINGAKQTFGEGINREFIQMKGEDNPLSNGHKVMEQKKVAVKHVIHPVTMEQINYHTAVLQGVLLPAEGIYRSPVTGDSLTIDEALEKGLIKGILLSTKSKRVRFQMEPESPKPVEAVYTEKRSYTITHAKDTLSGKNLTISEARKKNILDLDLTTYRDLRTNKIYSIQEAIDNCYLVATLDDTSCLTPRAANEGTKYISTKTHAIQAVVNPTTQKDMSVRDAVKEGIIREETGDYVNLDEEISFSMDTAIKKGLIKTKPAPVPVDETISFSISHVVDPKTGEEMSVAEALRHGFLDRGRRHFCDAYNGQLYSLSDAMQRGWVHLKTNVEISGYMKDANNNAGGFKMFNDQSAVPVISPISATFSIASVRDVAGRQDLAVNVATSRGILDLQKQMFVNTASGSVIPVEQAVKYNWIKLTPILTPPPTTRQWEQTSHQSYSQPVSRPPNLTSKGPIHASAGLYSGLTPLPANIITNRPSGTNNSGYAAVNGRQSQPKQAQNDGNHYQTIKSSMSPASSQLSQSSPKDANGEPLYASVKKPHSRHQSDPMTTDNIPTSANTHNQSPREVTDIYVALTRGHLNHSTGEVTLPQYGTSMLIDDAIVQGLITTKVPVNVLMYRPYDPSSFSMHEAFKRGFINPITLAVRHPATGQFMSLESALTTGLLQPRASFSASAAHHPPPSASVYSVPNQPPRRARSESASRVERRQVVHRNQPPNIDVADRGRSMHRNQPIASQLSISNPQSTQPMYSKVQKASQSSHQLYSTVKSNNGHANQPRPIPTKDHNANVVNINGLEMGTNMTLDHGRSGSHLVNGKLYTARHGYHINSHGMVVNLNTAEAINLHQAEKVGIVRRLSDNNRAESYVPASNLMFNRDPHPFPIASGGRGRGARPSRSRSLDRRLTGYAMVNGQAMPLENIYAEIAQ